MQIRYTASIVLGADHLTFGGGVLEDFKKEFPATQGERKKKSCSIQSRKKISCKRERSKKISCNSSLSLHVLGFGAVIHFL
jgi:hypothetical protein